MMLSFYLFLHVIKLGLCYMTFAQILSQIYGLDELMLARASLQIFCQFLQKIAYMKGTDVFMISRGFLFLWFHPNIKHAWVWF